MIICNVCLFTIYVFLISLNKKISTSSTCVSGELGASATIVACEAKNIYCQISTDMTTSPSTVTASCTNFCADQTSIGYTVCYAGENSNKIGFLCFVGDMLYSGGVAVMCNSGHYCQNTFYWVPNPIGSPIPANITGSCSSTCTWITPPNNQISKLTISQECYMGDFGNKKGNICFVGTFGVDAQIRGCPFQNVCKYDSSNKTGACVNSLNCVTTGTVRCYNTDLGNKQGPMCYVGQFNGAKMINCAFGQYCARNEGSNAITGLYTIGSCQTFCISNSTNFCCQSDYCNTYSPLYSSFGLKSKKNFIFMILFIYFLLFKEIIFLD